MSKTQISIKLDTDLLGRIDQLAEDVGVTRTAIIEKALKNDVPSQEAFYRSLEDPVMRAVHSQLTKPSVLRLLARITDGGISDSEIEEITAKAPRQIEVGKRRQTEKKTTKQRSKKGDG